MELASNVQQPQQPLSQPPSQSNEHQENLPAVGKPYDLRPQPKPSPKHVEGYPKLPTLDKDSSLSKRQVRTYYSFLASTMKEQWNLSTGKRQRGRRQQPASSSKQSTAGGSPSQDTSALEDSQPGNGGNQVTQKLPQSDPIPQPHSAMRGQPVALPQPATNGLQPQIAAPVVMPPGGWFPSYMPVALGPPAPPSAFVSPFSAGRPNGTVGTHAQADAHGSQETPISAVGEEPKHGGASEKGGASKQVQPAERAIASKDGGESKVGGEGRGAPEDKPSAKRMKTAGETEIGAQRPSDVSAVPVPPPGMQLYYLALAPPLLTPPQHVPATGVQNSALYPYPHGLPMPPPMVPVYPLNHPATPPLVPIYPMMTFQGPPPPMVPMHPMNGARPAFFNPSHSSSQAPPIAKPAPPKPLPFQRPRPKLALGDLAKSVGATVKRARPQQGFPLGAGANVETNRNGVTAAGSARQLLVVRPAEPRRKLSRKERDATGKSYHS